MKILLALLWASTTLILSAEGVASMTTVSSSNRSQLDFHTLRVETKSQSGRTSIALFIKTDEKHPLTHCGLTIHAADGKAILAQFEPRLGSERIYFYVADELVKNVAILYHLPAAEVTSHVFRINAGEIGKLAKTR